MGQCYSKVKGSGTVPSSRRPEQQEQQPAPVVPSTTPPVSCEMILLVNSEPIESVQQQQQPVVRQLSENEKPAVRQLSGNDRQRIQETLDSLFPNFKPLTPDAPQWVKETPALCPGCAHEMDILTSKTNCRSCGRILCDRCCYRRPAIQNEKICGPCMGSAMTALRKRELSQLEIRVKRNSELIRRRNLSSCSTGSVISSTNSAKGGGDSRTSPYLRPSSAANVNESGCGTDGDEARNAGTSHDSSTDAPHLLCDGPLPI